jgi:hypothetical protein
MRVAIIGTAGAGHDSNKMTRELYERMFRDASERLVEWAAEPAKEIDLVSGGAAWADHVAVSLWLDSRVRSITLYLPAPFINGKYVETDAEPDAGLRANKLHDAFSRAMGASTLAGLNRAIDNGAAAWAVTPEILAAIPSLPSNPFLARNIFTGRCDAILAYTWSKKPNFPGENGTIHTWTQSKALDAMKIHVQLQTMKE